MQADVSEHKHVPVWNGVGVRRKYSLRINLEDPTWQEDLPKPIILIIFLREGVTPPTDRMSNHAFASFCPVDDRGGLGNGSVPCPPAQPTQPTSLRLHCPVLPHRAAMRTLESCTLLSLI